MESMSMSTRVKLSAMMFLQFMIVAVFWSQLYNYLGSIPNIGQYQFLGMSTMAFGCLAAPIIGMIADRHFASQKVLAVLNLACAILFFIAATQTTPVMIFIFLLLAMLCYMPTWGLTSGIALSNSTTDKFPQIRVFGSIGWVSSGLFSIIAVKLLDIKFDTTNLPLYCAAVISLISAGVSLLLPNTPPPAKGQPASIVDALGLKAVTLMKDFNFAVFMIVSLLVMVPFMIYFNFCGMFLKAQGFELITVTMNMGQVSEILFMLMIPLALARMGIKWALVAGLAALVIRYVAFYFGGSYDQNWLIYTAILVHGVIFGFFFVGGQIYVDKKAPPEIRAQAQGFLFLMTFGIGNFITSYWVMSLLNKKYTNEAGVLDWNSIWLITTVMSVVLLAVFLVFFHDKFKKEEPAKEEV